MNGPPTERTRPVTSGAGNDRDSDLSTSSQATRSRRQWTTLDVATLVELGISLAFHRARVAPIEALQHEVQPFDVRVAALARSLERAGGQRVA